VTGRELSLDVRFSSAQLTPGTVATMRGTVGPNLSESTETVTISGTVTRGTGYRAVHVAPDGECVVLTTTFTCTVALAPGGTAELDIRLRVDALNAPAVARQQLSVASSLAGQGNATTSTVPIRRDDDPPALAAAFTTLEMTRLPQAFLPLLAMLLFALAATHAGRRRTGSGSRSSNGSSGDNP
jgi:hypothetical protein